MKGAVVVEVLDYTPPPTVREFIKDYRPGALFYDWMVGPYGSGKTTGIFFKLAYMAKQQAKGKDGIRRTRAVIVRNTAPQLRDTTLSSWGYWFKDGQAGHWRATDKVFLLKFDDVECEVMFRPLDTPEDIARVLSLEVTFAIIDEFVELPREIVDALSARLGRYPSAKDGGATNWGMWGASNPSTEDNWWYDYLHNNLPRNARYFHQPSGFADDAENIENLPGGRGYYTNQAEGKSEAWVHQYIHANWGYSVAGKPVVPAFNAKLHLSSGLLVNRHQPLIVGLDPGLAGSGLVFGQLTVAGRLNVLGELVQSGYGATRLINERLKPYLARRDWQDMHLVIAPDPAASSRTQTDERSVVDVFKKHYEVKVETNNRLPLRLDAIDYYAARLVEGGPALLIDERECPELIRALKGGWRYAIDTKKDKVKGSEPEDNKHTHVGDAFGYLARFFHRQAERELRYGATGVKRAITPQRVNPYHMR